MANIIFRSVCRLYYVSNVLQGIKDNNFGVFSRPPLVCKMLERQGACLARKIHQLESPKLSTLAYWLFGKLVGFTKLGVPFWGPYNNKDFSI